MKDRTIKPAFIYKLDKIMIMNKLILSILFVCTIILPVECYAMAEAEKPDPETAIDFESIAIGEKLFKSKCSFCHKANSTETLVGPGLAGILKKPKLPSSNEPATSEMIAKRLRKPYKNMPSFSYLSDSEVKTMIAYLKTL